MYYIVKWVLILFVSTGDCEIRGITNHQAVFTNQAERDTFVLTLNTTKPNTAYGDYVDSVQVSTSSKVPTFKGYVKRDTICGK